MRITWVAGLLILAVWGGAQAWLPVRWTHSLSDQCRWHTRPWARLVGANSREGYLDAWVRQQCLAHRGLKSPTPIVKEVLREWPQEAIHENHFPLSAAERVPRISSRASR